MHSAEANEEMRRNSNRFTKLLVSETVCAAICATSQPLTLGSQFDRFSRELSSPESTMFGPVCEAQCLHAHKSHSPCFSCKVCRPALKHSEVNLREVHFLILVNFAPFREISSMSPFASKTKPTIGSLSVVVSRRFPPPTSIRATVPSTPTSQPWTF